LQLLNYSALGIEVNPEAHSYTLCFEIFNKLIVNFGDDTLTSTSITTAESSLRTS